MKKLLTILGSVGLVASTGISVIGCANKTDDLSKLNLEELNQKWKDFNDLGKELLEKFSDPNLTEDQRQEILNQMTKNSFEMLSFLAQVFLETKYLPVIDAEKIDQWTITENTDNAEYQKELNQYIQRLEEILKEPDPTGKYQDYINILKDYVVKLKEKLETPKSIIDSRKSQDWEYLYLDKAQASVVDNLYLCPWKDEGIYDPLNQKTIAQFDIMCIYENKKLMPSRQSIFILNSIKQTFNLLAYNLNTHQLDWFEYAAQLTEKGLEIFLGQNFGTKSNLENITLLTTQIWQTKS